MEVEQIIDILGWVGLSLTALALFLQHVGLEVRGDLLRKNECRERDIRNAVSELHDEVSGIYDYESD